MKQFLLSLFFVLCVLKSAVAVPATVDYIFDGDTFAAIVHLEDEIDISVRVRLINVDTPEIHGMCEKEISDALRAKDRLAELMKEYDFPLNPLVDTMNRISSWQGNTNDDPYLWQQVRYFEELIKQGYATKIK